MKTTTIILIFMLGMGLMSAMGQSKPRKVTATKDTSLFLTTGSIGTLSSVTDYYKPDTLQAYFNEITGVENGKLITQWVKGFRVDKQSNSLVYYINSGNEFYYSDKKTKVTNKIIQSY